MIEDVELLRRYAEEHSQEAFAELVRQRIGLVYSVALRHTRDPQRAEDAAQVVFTDLARHAATLCRRSVLAGWLYRTAQYAAIDIVRAEARRARRERKADAMQTESEGAHIDWDKVRPVLDRAIRDLRDVERDAIVLRFFDQRTFAQIGEALHLTEEAARKRIERALGHLQASLGRHGISSTAAALTAALAAPAGVAAPAGLAAAVTGAALAGATAGVGTMAAVVSFMSTSKIVAGAAAAAAAVAIGTACLEIEARRAADSAGADAAREHQALLAQVRAQPSPATASATAARPVARAAISPASAERTLAAVDGVVRQPEVPVRRGGNAEAIQAGRAFLQRNPAAERAFLDLLRAEFLGTFGERCRELGLTQAQVDAFEKAALYDWGYRTWGTGSQQLLLTVPGWDDARARREAREQAMALIPSETYAELLKLREQTPARRTVSDFATALVFTSDPLTPLQSKQLQRALVETSPRVDRHDWAAVVERARTILTPRQLELLQDFEAKARYTAAMQAVMQRASGAAPATTTPRS